MADSILDDVKALLEKEEGDKRILEQIQRAAENNEVISNFERNYVAKLAEQHLEKKPIVEETPEIPDVELPDTELSDPKVSEEKSTSTVQEIQYRPEPIVTKYGSKNTKLFAGIGAAVLAIIVVAGISLSGVYDKPDVVEPIPAETLPDEISGDVISIATDLTVYDKGDIISISGKSDPSFGNTIKLSIQDTSGSTVWAEDLDVKSDGRFSTLTFAGGFGWDSDGTFTLKVEHGDESESKTFSFNG